MINPPTNEEVFIEKRFKRDGFKVKKIDVHNKYKSPDFKILKSNFACLVEVKVGFKMGKVLERLPNGARQFDSSYAIEDYFRESVQKFKEHTTQNPEDKNLPYILTFVNPFFINNELKWSDLPYKKYSLISAVFIIKITDPYAKRAWSMELKELEKFIEINRSKIQSQKRFVWQVIKNPYAKNVLKINYFPSIYETLNPIKIQISTLTPDYLH